MVVEPDPGGHRQPRLVDAVPRAASSRLRMAKKSQGPHCPMSLVLPIGWRTPWWSQRSAKAAAVYWSAVFGVEY